MSTVYNAIYPARRFDIRPAGFTILTTMNLTAILPLSTLSTDPRWGWAPIVWLIVIAVGFALGNLVLSCWIGPKRTGKVKESTYESGMVPIGDTNKRFNVRFYIVAMVFLVFDVEIIFFYPWATIFRTYAAAMPEQSTFLLIEMMIFIAILLLAYVYAWGKGIFRWD